jgi:predicted NAD-dependent protein-ADP-ribosyltransferase YbiA (DUF1768 family)
MPRSKTIPLFFWRETESEGGFLSPWYLSSFSAYDHTYESIGHFIMASKARLFKDEVQTANLEQNYTMPGSLTPLNYRIL